HLTSRGDIIEAATKFYKTLYSSTKHNTTPKEDQVNPSSSNVKNIPPILQCKVRKAIKKLKNEKTLDVTRRHHRSSYKILQDTVFKHEAQYNTEGRSSQPVELKCEKHTSHTAMQGTESNQEIKE
ncbi:hypothetical protein C0J52_28215, partial [Blattella germanica]